MLEQVEKEVSFHYEKYSRGLKNISPPRFVQNPEVTFEQVNRTTAPVTVQNGNVSLALAEGVMHDVFVSSIVGGGEIKL